MKEKQQYYDDGTIKQADCAHSSYSLVDGKLLCSACGQPSPSPKWRTNIFGAKAVEKEETENKGVTWPPESKRKEK